MACEGVIKRALFLTLLTLISASVVPVPQDEEPVQRDTRAAACRLTDGRNIPDGDNFTRSDTGPCIFYSCNDGEVLPLDYNCYRNGQCYPLGDSYMLGCIERTCQLSNGRFEYSVTKEGCTARDPSGCVDVGSTDRDGCFEYRCDREQESAFSVAYHLKQIDIGCSLNGQCVGVNQTVTQGCRTLQCQQRFRAVGFQTISDGCDMNGQCVDTGTSVTVAEDCRTFTCEEENLNGHRILNLKATKIQCKDADGVCHDSGEWFPLLVDDQDRVNCTCAVAGMTVALSCPEVGIVSPIG